MTPERLAELRKLCDAALDGPLPEALDEIERLRQALNNIRYDSPCTPHREMSGASCGKPDGVQHALDLLLRRSTEPKQMSYRDDLQAAIQRAEAAEGELRRHRAKPRGYEPEAFAAVFGIGIIIGIILMVALCKYYGHGWQYLRQSADAKNASAKPFVRTLGNSCFGDKYELGIGKWPAKNYCYDEPMRVPQ